jgi:uncharacterized membrane protein
MAAFQSVLRLLYMIIAALMVLSGLFWALQGLGIIMWPPESFMLADRKWTLYGLLWAAGWAGLIWVLRSPRR